MWLGLGYWANALYCKADRNYAAYHEGWASSDSELENITYILYLCLGPFLFLRLWYYQHEQGEKGSKSRM